MCSFLSVQEAIRRTEQESIDMERIPHALVVGTWKHNVCCDCTRPDLSHEVGVVSRFMNCCFLILRYIQNSLDIDVVFSRNCWCFKLLERYK